MTTTAPLALTISGMPAPFEPEVPLEGARVCETDTDNCVLTDMNGEATIWLPSDEEISYTIEKEGYDSLLIAAVIPQGGAGRSWPMATVGTMADLYESLMSPSPGSAQERSPSKYSVRWRARRSTS